MNGNYMKSCSVIIINDKALICEICVVTLHMHPLVVEEIVKPKTPNHLKS
jgi:hypothetical protein